MFKALVGHVQGMVDVASASISPWKVQTVKLDDYSNFPVKHKNGYFILYQRRGCNECLVTNLVMRKTLSVFRLVDDTESNTQFHSLQSKLNPVLDSSSGAYQESKLQEMCDTVRDHPTWSSAHIAAHVGLFECFRNPQIMEQLDSNCPTSGVTPLMTAVSGKQLQCAKQLLQLGARINIQDMHGDTVYHKAVTADPQIVKILVEYDKERVINWLNNKGFTALSIACKRTLPDVVDCLVSHGADPSVTAHDRLPIHEAVRAGDEQSVGTICKTFTNQLEARDGRFGGTPLHWAKTRKMIEVLTAFRSNLNAQCEKTGETALHVMLVKNRTDCVIELLSHGADCSIGDNEGNTPLHHVVQKGDVELLRIFIVYGSSVNRRNKNGYTPRHIAATSNMKNKAFILYMLHVSGAERCGTDVKGCLNGCYAEGKNNGEPDPETESLLEADSVVIADEVLTSFSSDEVDGNDKSAQGLRVLTLDGGGIRGLVTIQILMALEEAAGRPIHECFDWIGGTSTGGILALGIALKKKLSYLKTLYMRLKNEVFQGKRPYSSKRLEELLKEEIGENVMMTDIKHPKLTVMALLADRFPAQLHVFRSYEPTMERETITESKDSIKSKKGKNKTTEPPYYKPPPPHEQLAWKAARSSGAAPTYFQACDAYLDGGLISNNPTLDVLTEIQEYNTGLKLRNQGELCQNLGVVVSLGTGRVPQKHSKAFDVYMPEGIFEVTKVAQGVQTLLNILVDQASIAEGRPVDRARAWCSSLGVPFFRLSPRLADDVALDTNDEKILTKMLWNTQVYIVANKTRIQKIADLLKG